MAQLAWDSVGERFYETGVDHGVLYIPDNAGNYDEGVAWNGLTTVTESPSGAEPTPLYADNIKYLSLTSAEEFGGSIEAFTYPDEFMQCDGTAEPEPGVMVGQQNRTIFGLAYRTLLGNDTEGDAHGYKLHLVYGAKASPSEKAYATINDSPEAIAFSWDFTTTPVAVPNLKPAATLVIDSTQVDADGLAALEDELYGTAGTDPRLPLPAEVLAFFSGAVTEVQTVAPTFDAGTDVITIPATAGVVYSMNGEDVAAGPQDPITETTIVEARPAPGYSFTEGSDDDWAFDPTP